ncbi:hypothetical protein T492DRAFT_1139067 [Pavlovales sp. CCMP2436]|nr:hypothetical protein T492DRAFT_1139067 [Pavlovales sp. CCMP2436]
MNVFTTKNPKEGTCTFWKPASGEVNLGARGIADAHAGAAGTGRADHVTRADRIATDEVIAKYFAFLYLTPPSPSQISFILKSGGDEVPKLEDRRRKKKKKKKVFNVPLRGEAAARTRAARGVRGARGTAPSNAGGGACGTAPSNAARNIINDNNKKNYDDDDYDDDYR